MIVKAQEISYIPADISRWSNLLQQSRHSSYRNDVSYYATRDNEEKTVSSFIFSENNKDVAGVNYLLKRSCLNLITVSDLVGGVLFREEPEPEIYSQIIDHYLTWADSNRVDFARVSSWLPKKIDGREIDSTLAIEAILKRIGFNQTAPPKHTYWLDLSISETGLLSRMNPKTRYGIKQAIRYGLETVVYEKPEDSIIDLFWENYSMIGRRKNFRMYPESKLKNEIASLLDNGLASLFVTVCKGRHVNYAISSKLMIASYLHGAIYPYYRSIEGCPSPGQFAQWEMIRRSKENGSSIFDLGFCPGPIPDPDHPKYLIWRFKAGFGGMPVMFLPVFGKSLSTNKGRLFLLLNRRQWR